MKSLLLSICFMVLVVYIFICLYLYFKQTDLMFFPDKTVSQVNMNSIKEVSFVTQDDIKLHGWYIDNTSDKTILFFHGNGGNISRNTERIIAAKELGYNLFMFDYRGYGKSDGLIQKEEDIYTDGKAAYGYLLKRIGGDSKKILFWGHSMGGAIAIHTAQGQKLGGIIVESSFTSMDEMAQYQYPYIPTGLLLDYHFRSIEKIEKIPTKILIIHSPTDEVIPYTYGKHLFKKAKEPKEFLTISGSHNGGFTASRNQIQKKIETFFSDTKGK